MYPDVRGPARRSMARPFADRLGSFPVVLEVVPPSKRASDRAVDALVARTRKAIGVPAAIRRKLEETA